MKIIRISDEVHTALQLMGKQEQRTVSNQAEFLLRNALEAYACQSPTPKSVEVQKRLLSKPSSEG